MLGVCTVATAVIAQQTAHASATASMIVSLRCTQSVDKRLTADIDCTECNLV